MQLVGPNGAGKTSLLRVLAGLSERYSGELFCIGKPLSTERQHWAAVCGYLSHQHGNKAMLSARENLQWYAAMHGADASPAALDAALLRVGLDGYQDLPCYQLSAGQRQRAALARLFVLPKKLWLLDEPFTAIDRQGVAWLEQSLQQFVSDGGAILLTTHHPLQLPGLIRLELELAA